MKRILLLILGFLFLLLWVAGLFYPTRLTGIHLALIVALLFFIRSVMVIKTPVAKKAADEAFIDINQTFEKNHANGINEIMTDVKPEIQHAR